jgi:uncharacterized protein YdaT
MASEKVFVEQRNEKDFAVRKPKSERASAVKPSQKEAVKRAEELSDAAPSVERVRNTETGKRDQWRKA